MFSCCFLTFIFIFVAVILTILLVRHHLRLCATDHRSLSVCSLSVGPATKHHARISLRSNFQCGQPYRLRINDQRGP